MHRYLKAKHKTQAVSTGSSVAAPHPNLQEQLPVKDFSRQYSSVGYGGQEHQYSPLGDGGKDGINLYEQLLAQGFSKEDIHSAFHKVIMHRAACRKVYEQLPLTGKIKWHCKKYSEQVTGSLLRLTAKGLMLLKTQFAKKPKNPV